ncbi:MAG: glycosyltransferase [Acidobacteriota bacterium]|nr:glycosyltransferase [Acidobacteriota bacterium]
MAKIFLATQPLTSHIHTGLFVWRQLSDAGHDVTWLCVENDRRKLEKHAIKTLPILSETYPPDLNERVRAMGFWKRLRIQRTMMSSFFHEIEQDFNALMDEHQPNLFILDALNQWMGLGPLSRGIPVIYLSTTFPTLRRGDMPPIATRLYPPQNEAERKYIDKIWRRMLRPKNNRKRAQGIRLTKKMAKRCGYPLAPEYFDDPLSIDLPAPKLIACSEVLDFPHEDHPYVHYIGPGVDLGRDEETFTAPPDKKLVYCALSTLRQFLGPQKTILFFNKVIEAVATLPDYHLLLSTCGLPFAPENAPDNVTVVELAPQINVLKKAHLMITHGGLNSIKEALLNAVPLIGFPLAYDQPGNIARVAYHGLGFHGGRIAHTTAEQIRKLILEIDGDEAIRDRLRAMSERMTADQQTPKVVDFVADYLSKASTAGQV